MLRPANQMLPREIIEAREKSSCAFVPVSPVFEWHSFHLPMGTDALIAEGIAAAMAERVGGIYFPPLSFGLDEYRPKDQLLAWGFKKTDKVFGMRFPDLPLSSEYCHVPEMSMAVANRLEAIRQSGFKFAFIVNNHGGAGQFDLLEHIATMSDCPPVAGCPGNLAGAGRTGGEVAMDIGESHLIMAYTAVIGIHVVYLTYVAIKFVQSGKRLK